MNKFKWLLLIPAFIFMASDTALACLCEGVNIKQGHKRSDAVFTGELISMKDDMFTYKIDRAWKGVSEREITVRDLSAGTSCTRTQFKVGQRYLVFASFPKELVNDGKNEPFVRLVPDEQNKLVLYVNFCFPNVQIENAKIEKKIQRKIGKGKTFN